MPAALRLDEVDCVRHWQEGDAEHALWLAALTLLLTDARDYWKGGRKLEFEQAFDDVLRVGPMLRRLCNHTGHEPQWVAERFCKSLEKARNAASGEVKV